MRDVYGGDAKLPPNRNKIFSSTDPKIFGLNHKSLVCFDVSAFRYALLLENISSMKYKLQMGELLFYV